MNGNSSKLSCRRSFFCGLNLVYQSKLETTFQISLLLVTATERLSTRSGFGQAASFSPCPALDIGAAGQCPDLGIRPTDPHFVRERSVVENRLQKTPQKMSRKKRPMQKMSQIHESFIYQLYISCSKIQPCHMIHQCKAH